MHILWISDFSLSHHLGGAQRSNQIIIDKGKSKGYIITTFHYDSDPNILEQNNYDLVISSNLEHVRTKFPWINDWICQQNNHIRYEHDSHQYNSFEERKRIFDSTKLNIFVSQLHMDKFVEHYEVNPSKSVYVVDPIDLNLFKDLGLHREDKTLYVGTFHQEKGTDLFLQEVNRNPNKKYIMLGFTDRDAQIVQKFPNIEFYKNVAYDHMPTVYNSIREFWFYPRGAYPLFIEPFCRATAEAILCGMEMNVGVNIGSYELYKQIGLDGLKKECHNAPNKFWKEIEKVV